MRRNTFYLLAAILLVSLACEAVAPASTPTTFPTPEKSVFDSGKTAYGFFPSPSEVSTESIFNLYKIFDDHADVVLYQNEIPWSDFVDSPDANSKKIDDLRGQMVLARQYGLEGIFVVDPLNGLNRREFYHLPFGWKASFKNPKVRSAFTNYTLRIVREFQPYYLGLASEINTYADAHPEDFPNYLSLYRDVYAAVKAEAPETQIFVTFQWEDLNNLFPQPDEDAAPLGQIKWDLVEAFEPELDLWVISSYPYITFGSADQIPADYYTPLLTRTDKPLAVAEGGWISEDFQHIKATPEDQVGYLNAIHDQIGPRLDFWIYLLAQDLNLESYRKLIKGRDLETLGFFTTVGMITTDGTPKPALDVWDSYRSQP
jgi:hypothetical protein